MPEPVDPTPPTVSGRHATETRGVRLRPSPPALEANTPRLVTIGIGIWLVFFVVGLVRDDSTWMWTCAAGVVLGLAGLVLARQAARRAAAAGR